MKKFFPTIALVAALFMSACVSVLPETAPPAPRYSIDSVSFSETSTPVSWSLIVADPTSSQLYNTTKVALTREANRFEFYAGTEWADRAPVLLQRALVRSFENTNRIIKVGDFSTLSVSDYVLNTDIRSLHVDYISGNPEAVVTVYARLVDKTGDIKAVRNFTSRSSIDRDAVPSVMASFDATLQEILTGLVEWGFSEGER